MKWIFSAVLFCGAFPAQSFAPIKGHVIGETFEEYVKKTSGLTEHLRLCAGNFGSQLDADKNAPTTCKNLDAAKMGLLNVEVYIGTDFTKAPEDGPRDYGKFTMGRLVEMDVSLAQQEMNGGEGISYEDVLRSMQARFGEPVHTETVPGTTAAPDRPFVRNAIFVKGGIEAMVGECGSKTKPRILIMLATKEELDRRDKARKAVDVLK
jgi:hypothetical protein